MKKMKKKLLSLLLAFSLLLTPAFAEEGGEIAPEASEPAKKQLSVQQQENIIRDFAHFMADSYFYGVSDTNLLYSVICATIENDGKFDVDLSLKAMLDILGDEYAEFYSPEDYAKQTEYFNASFFGIGIVMAPSGGGTVVESVYANGPAEEAGIKAGDKITAVNGTDTAEMPPAQVRSLIVGDEGTSVEITLDRDGSVITVYPVRGKVTESHSSMEILENKIAYIKVSSFTASLPEEFDSYIAQLREKGIVNVIIDLRDNGGGDLDASIDVAKKLTPAGKIGIIKRYKDGSQVEEIFSENTNAPLFKTIVMVNENTASASEFLAMALQSTGRAKLLGTKTYGKGCMQLMMRSPTGSGIKFTVGEYFTPKDARVHTVGLTPDLPVENEVIPVNSEEFAAIDFMKLESEQTRLGVEQRLNAVRLLPDSETDGVFNGDTEAAIRVFQRYSGLEETGMLDFYTALKINDYVYDGLNKIVDVQMDEALKYFEK